MGLSASPELLTTVTLFASLNRTGGEFLLTDAETAHTFLDIAETTNNEVTARREINLAIDAVRTIERFLPKLELDPDLRQAIESSLDRLNKRLETLQPRFNR